MRTLALGGLIFALLVVGDAHASTASSPRLSDARIGAMIRAAFPDDPITAECIASAESGGGHGHFNQYAYNSGQYGLFQIAAVWHPGFDTRRGFDPAYNIAWARHIYLDAKARYGWRYRWSGPSGTLWTTAHGCGA